MSEKMTTNEPSTEEIVRNFRGAHIFGITQALENRIADRLESQERTIADKDAKIAALTARAEQAEAREKAAIADMKLIADNVRETHCDETCCFACKYDCDTSINDSGEFNSECPGFYRDDCFEWRGTREGERND